MSLINDFAVDCVLMEQTSTPDGEGGYNVEWVEGVTFKAAITTKESIEAKRAEKDGVISKYTVTTPKNVILCYHEVFKRLSDGKVFRITEGETITPERASFQFRQTKAEEWELT